MKNAKEWEESDKENYIQHDILRIIKLYVEQYVIDSDKGFKNLEEKIKRQQMLSDGINDVIQECSKDLGISTTKIVASLKTYFDQNSTNAEIRKNYDEEYALIRKILDEVLQKEDLER